MALVTIAITPNGKFESLFERFLYGIDLYPVAQCLETRTNVKTADRVVHSITIPQGILARAITSSVNNFLNFLQKILPHSGPMDLL